MVSCSLLDSPRIYRWLNGSLFLLGIGWMMWDLPFIILVLPTDFDYYFQAAQQLAQGHNPYYNWMAEAVRSDMRSWYLYPPYFAGALYPFTLLGHIQAKAVFAFLSVFSLIGIDLLLMDIRRKLSPDDRLVDFLIHGLVFFALPTRLVLGSLQIESILFFLFLGMLFIVSRQGNVSGACLAFTPGVLVKLWPGPFLVSLVAWYGGRIVIYTVLCSLTVAGMFTLAFGWEPQWIFMRDMLPVLSMYVDTYKDNQSLSLWMLYNIPVLSMIVPFLRGLILTGYVILTCRNGTALRQQSWRAMVVNAGLFVTVSLLVTPTAWTASHIRLLLPLVLSCLFLPALSKKPKIISFWVFLSLLFYIYPQEMFKTVLPVWIDRFPMLWACGIQYGLFMRWSWKRWDRAASRDS